MKNAPEDDVDQEIKDNSRANFGKIT